MLKRTLAIVLALVMIIGLLPILPASTTAFAAESGTCGANMTWSLDNAGTLTITGYGEMYDYKSTFRPPWYSWYSSIEKLVFENIGIGITHIGNYAFCSCNNLKDFSLPESVTSIGDYAFESCSSLTKVPSASRLKNVTSLGVGVFFNCSGIKEAVIPPSLSYLPHYTFYGCSALTSVVIPENITLLCIQAFACCSSLESVVLNTGVTQLGTYAFQDCTALKEVYIVNPLEMREDAFKNCPSSAKFFITPSKSEFESKSTIDASNEGYQNAAHYYAIRFPVVMYPNGGSSGLFSDPWKPITLYKSSTGDFNVGSSSSVVPSREGYIFNNWNTKPDGSGTTYKPGDEYTANAALNLYAQWQEIPVKRLSGSSRNGTAVEISKEVEKILGKCEAVVLANGWDFADALAGGPLARSLNAPILLITGDDNDQATFAEIKRLGVKDVYILGGKVAVSESVETKLKNEGCTVYRVAGNNRFETAVLIAQRMDSLYTDHSERAIFAYSHNYPDALAVSGIAAVTSTPILYIGSDGVLDPATKAYVEKCEFEKSYILGGTGAISSAAENNIKNAGSKKALRIAGENRYETCLEINRAFSLNHGTELCVSTGANFPDALAGSVLAACKMAPMLLVDPTEPLSDAQKDYLEKYYIYGEGKAFIFGGKVAVPEAIETELKALVP